MSRYLSLASEVLPRQAQVVICGAGTVANSVAYHLVNNGWNDVLVLEKERIGSGTSHFGSGTLGLFKPPEERRLITYSIQLYRRLQEMGYNIGLKQCGSLNLAQTKDRMISLRRQVAYHQATGLHCQVLGRDELKKLHPYLRTEDLEGGVWVPEDAVADPKEVCAALAKLAKAGGARYVENCRVERVVTEDGRVKGVETSGGGVLCEFLVNCAGMWARELGLSCRPRVRVPACPAEHFYVTTGAATPPLDDDALLPCLRDYDAHVYARQWGGGFMVGGFEPEAKPAFGGGGVPEDWRRQLPEDWAHFRPLWERAMHRLPLLETLPDPQLTNSPDNFTPDGKWILGEAPEVGNYFVAVGMNGNSLQGAGGIGRAVAEWMAEGESSADLLPFSVQRFLDLHNNGRYLQQRTREVVGRHYQLLYPLQSEYKYARGLRCSPLYSVLRARGGVFGTRMGYERPLYFDTTSKDPQMPPGTFFKPLFLDFLRDEYVACNEGVGLIDMSSFSKVEVKSKGGEALAFLQRLCSEDADLAVGGVAHTGMLNERGGYENDCLLVRQGEGSFLLVSPTSQQTRVMEWLRRHRPPEKGRGGGGPHLHVHGAERGGPPSPGAAGRAVRLFRGGAAAALHQQTAERGLRLRGHVPGHDAHGGGGLLPAGALRVRAARVRAAGGGGGGLRGQGRGLPHAALHASGALHPLLGGGAHGEGHALRGRGRPSRQARQGSVRGAGRPQGAAPAGGGAAPRAAGARGPGGGQARVAVGRRARVPRRPLRGGGHLGGLRLLPREARLPRLREPPRRRPRHPRVRARPRRPLRGGRRRAALPGPPPPALAHQGRPPRPRAHATVRHLGATRAAAHLEDWYRLNAFVWCFNLANLPGGY